MKLNLRLTSQCPQCPILSKVAGVRTKNDVHLFLRVPTETNQTGCLIGWLVPLLGFLNVTYHQSFSMYLFLRNVGICNPKIQFIVVTFLRRLKAPFKYILMPMKALFLDSCIQDLRQPCKKIRGIITLVLRQQYGSIMSNANSLSLTQPLLFL